MARAAALAWCWLAVTGAMAAELKTETLQAFERYIRSTESRLDEQARPGSRFLWADEDTNRLRGVRAGQVAIENRGGSAVAVPGGLIHDWVGAVFIPGVTLEKTLTLVQDYNHHKDVYQPEVLDSRLIRRDGDDFKVHLRLMKKKVITVVLDSDYDVHYYRLDAARVHSRAYSTRIVEVENPGKPDERPAPPDKDHGFLWRLDSYWRFQERDGGVYVECEAISLTRGIPAGLGWLIEPIVNSLPRESLANTLRETRAAVAR